MEKIDVVVPVYGAVPYVVRCLESLERHLSEHLGRIIVYDDASPMEEFRELERLIPGRAVLHRSPVNRGFGQTVNAAMELAESGLVLVLNSDVEACDDFLAPLLEAMRDDRLLAVNPVFEKSDRFRFYDHSRGYVPSYMLRGYAFLTRRRAFLDIGGFDPVFGRGYFEDYDLARRLCREGGITGVVPASVLPHHGTKSFPSEEARRLQERNRRIYEERYPDAQRRVLLVKNVPYAALDDGVRSACERLCRAGGRVAVVGHGIGERLPNTRLIPVRHGWIGMMLYVNRNILRSHRRSRGITEIWFAEGGRATRAWFRRLAERHGLTFREPEELGAGER